MSVCTLASPCFPPHPMTSPASPPPLPGSPCTDCAGHADCVMGRLPQAMRQQWGAALQERRFTKGQVLAEQGAQAHSMRVIKTGSVLLQGRHWDGSYQPVALVGRGAVTGLLGIHGQGNALGLRAASAGRYCEIDHQALRAGPVRSVEWRDAMAAIVAQSYQCLADWAQVVRVRQVTHRMGAALLLIGKEQRSPLVRLPDHASLAALLGMSRESVVRALASLQQQGCLKRRDASHYELQQPALLQCLYRENDGSRG